MKQIIVSPLDSSALKSHFISAVMAGIVALPFRTRGLRPIPERVTIIRKAFIFMLSTFCTFTLIVLLLSACGGGGGGDDDIAPALSAPKQVRALSIEEQSLVKSDNSFGLDLFQKIVKAEGDKNIFISPLSVSMALGMTYNGANGATQQAMEATLRLSGLTLQEINNSYRSLIDLLATLDPKVLFDIANSIWYRQGFTVENEFINLNKTYFNAEVYSLDFNSRGAADIINGWVDEKTKGKITKIVAPPIDPLSVMFLINAIYFKGAWANKFNENYTKDDWFTLSDGSGKLCKMMYKVAHFRQFSTSDFVAVDLPYGDGDFSMTIFLPLEGKNIDDVMANLNQENWDQWMQKFHTSEIALALPKFTLKYELTLNDTLKALGMGVAFDPSQADFTKMHKKGGMYIDNVQHKTYIEVNEEGTEAAAVTSVEVRVTSLPRDIRVDRPFVFAVRENRSQTIFFLGKIVDPTLK